jgi:hypothetical protein
MLDNLAAKSRYDKIGYFEKITNIYLIEGIDQLAFKPYLCAFLSEKINE